MKPFSGEHKICKHVVELHWRQTGKIKLLVSMKIERCKALFLYIIESLRCYYSAVWEKVVKKRCFFSPMNFTSSSHLPFPTVRHLPFGIARQRSVEFKIKGEKIAVEVYSLRGRKSWWFHVFVLFGTPKKNEEVLKHEIFCAVNDLVFLKSLFLRTWH